MAQPTKKYRLGESRLFAELNERQRVTARCAHCGESREGSLDETRRWFETHLQRRHPEEAARPRTPRRRGRGTIVRR